MNLFGADRQELNDIADLVCRYLQLGSTDGLTGGYEEKLELIFRAVSYGIGFADILKDHTKDDTEQ